MNKKFKINERGQALLLVLVGMGSVLVMALSVISRSITDISLSGKEDEASRAFSAAEAGIEHLLVSTNALPYDDPDLGVTASVSFLSENTNSYFLPQNLLSGETGTVWFVSHDDTGEKLSCGSGKPCFASNPATMDVYWGEDTTADIPALEVVLYYDSGTPKQAIAATPNYSNVKVMRFAYDISASSRGNSFATTVTTNNTTFEGTNFKYHLSTPINLGAVGCNNVSGCLLFAKIRLLYNASAQPVAVSVASDTLPAQAKKLESVGTSGESVRKVELIQTYKEPFAVFESGLYSGVDLNKSI